MERTDGRGTLTRRAFVAGTVGTTAAVAASRDARAQERVTVEMTDGLVFDPESVTVVPGTTVVWENVGQVGHSVTAYEGELPADAEYFASADAGSEGATRDAYPAEGDVAGGERYEHTFDVEGTYEYFCIPHESAGMLGTVVVGEDAGGEGGDGGGIPVVGDDARTLGLATLATLVLLVGFTYVLLEYGGDYGE
jgi:plastocyanin